MKPWHTHFSQDQLYLLFSLIRNKNTTEYNEKLKVIILTLIELLEIRESIPSSDNYASIAVTSADGTVQKDVQDMERIRDEMMRHFKKNADKDVKEARAWFPKPTRYTTGG